MNEDINQMIASIHPERLNTYWPGFHPGPYAIYNDRNVYIMNHPHYKHRGNLFRRIKRTDDFKADTLILFDGQPTAIVSIDRYQDVDQLYAILIHELFHGFQYVQGEKRFPDELLGATYPISLENIQLRNEERMHLFHALMERSRKQKLRHIRDFISKRERRKQLMNNHLHYENLIETIEGPARYVEAKAYGDRCGLPLKKVAEEFGADLLDGIESSINIRKSCYSSGLFLCLLLDQLEINWHKDFMDADLSLYDFFKQKTNNHPISIIHISVNKETKQIASNIRNKKTEEFRSFYNQSGFQLTIRASMKISKLDPMNIVSLDQRLLHKNFVKIKIKETTVLFQKPVVTHFQENPWSCNEVQIMLEEKPKIQNGFLHLYSHRIKGTLEEKDGMLIFHPDAP
ncbi:hypothetical protein [Fervidibacillus halotolerans]|uniref:Peptide ABC transporter permease n=1 Tax=Fervidibacillus halotolerans TaxID=2980027 RepID=A0A9E8LXZ0_9BACI|nr:hypothetical protein [Fervidibacillus halotolerans]WAA11798.1 hypothetical protein OE105_09245 [Fervidibacillus halotolerans]